MTRKYATLFGELENVLRKGKNLVEEIARLEHNSRALAHAREKAEQPALFTLEYSDPLNFPNLKCLALGVHSMTN